MIDHNTQLLSAVIDQKLGTVIYHGTLKLGTVIYPVTLKLGIVIYHVTQKLGIVIYHGTQKLGILIYHGTQDQSLYAEFPATEKDRTQSICKHLNGILGQIVSKLLMLIDGRHNVIT